MSSTATPIARPARRAKPGLASPHRRRDSSRAGPESVGHDAVTEPPAPDADRTQVTRILVQVNERPEAASELMPLVYDQLYAIARQRMREERAGHTLQATALVHEAYMRLVGDAEISWESRAHFFRTAAEAMRRILIDHARKRNAAKRGGGRSALPISVVDLAADNDPSRVLALDEALRTLEEEDARAAEIVQLRFFAGLSVDDTAEAMGLSRRTVMREWAFARARLFELLEPQD